MDQLCDACNIITRFGTNSFDVLVATELLEHVKDWQLAISNFKSILRIGGIIFITTRSYGFGYHGFPYDFWRFEISDVEKIFSDFDILSLEKDPIEPGIFMKARKPFDFVENKTTDCKLYSMVKERPILRITTLDILWFRTQHFIKYLSSLPIRIVNYIIRHIKELK